MPKCVQCKHTVRQARDDPYTQTRSQGGAKGDRPPQEHEQAPPCAERDTDDEDNDKWVA